MISSGVGDNGPRPAPVSGQSAQSTDAEATPTPCQSTRCRPINEQLAAADAPGNGGDVGQEEKPAREKMTKPQLFTLFAICFTSLCSATFYSLLAPFFPTEAAKKGASHTEVGAIFGVFQAVVFLSSPVFGNYITTFGPRFMFITGIFSTSICVMLFGALEWCPPGTIYVVMCLSVRSVEALSAASTSTSSQVIAAHTFQSHLTYVMGILQACGCVGLMIGPPIGGMLFAVGGFYFPFVITGGLFLLGGFVSLCLLPAQEAEPSVHKGSKLALLQIPLVLVLGYLVAVGQLAMGFIDVALAVHLQQFNLHPAIVGLVFLVAPVTVVILAPMVGWLTDKFTWTVRPVLIIGTLVATGGFLALGPSPLMPFLPQNDLWMLVGALAVSGTGWASLVVTFPEFIRAAHEKGFPKSMETQGMVSGVYNAFNSMGALIGPTFGGFLLQRYQFGWASTMVAASAGLAALLMILYTLVEVTCHTSHRPEEDRTELVD